MASQRFSSIVSSHATRRRALVISPAEVAVNQENANPRGISRLTSNILEKGKELLARRNARSRPLREGRPVHHEQPVATKLKRLAGARSANNSPNTSSAVLDGYRDEAPSNDGDCQHAIPDAHQVPGSSPRWRDPPDVPEEPPTPIDAMEEPKIEHAELQAHLDVLDFRKEEMDKAITQSLKTLNDVLSCSTAMRLRMCAILVEARSMEQILLKSEREEAMVAEAAEDGEQDAKRIEASSGEESSSEGDSEEDENQRERFAEIDSSVLRVINVAKTRTSGHSAHSKPEKSPSSLRKRARDDFDEKSVTSASDEAGTPTRASKKRRNEASRATMQQVGESSGSGALHMTADSDGPLVTPPATADERAKLKGKKPMRETTPSPPRSSKSQGKRKANKVDRDEAFLRNRTAKRGKQDTSLRHPPSPMRRHL